MKFLRAPALLLAALCAAACTPGVQSVSDPAGEQAAAIQWLWHLLLWVCVPIYLLVLAALALALRRKRAVPTREGEEEAGPARGLLLFAALVALILLGLSLASFSVDRKLLQGERDAAVNLKVSGKQWWWQVEYGGADASQHFQTANEIHLPAGRTARIELVGADVIHSLWIPRLAGKLDLVPGRTNVLWLTPSRVGRFRGQCAEFCGLEHARMALDVQVHSPQDFERWRRQQLKPAPPPRSALALRGQQVVVGGPCAMCHAITGTPASAHSAPDLTHLASRSTIAAGTMPMSAASLRTWLRDPQGVKPGTNMPRVPLTDADLEAVVAYLETLR